MQPRHAASQVDDRLAGEDLSRLRDRAETRCQIESAAPVAALSRDRLARVEPDAETKREGRAIIRLLARAPLEIDGGAERLAGRRECDERFVTSKLDQ